MKILFISAIDFPEPLDRGARYHVHYWLKALSTEHDLDFLLVESYPWRREKTPQLSSAKVINLGEPPDRSTVAQFKRAIWSLVSGVPGSALAAMPRAAKRFVRQAVKEKRYDLAILWNSSAAGYGRLLKGAVPVIQSRLSVGAIDARDQRRRAGMWRPQWMLAEWVIRRFEARTCREASSICTVNTEDAQELVTRYKLTNSVQAIPVGVEIRDFAAREDDPQTKVVGFVGNLYWGANVDAVKYLMQEIVPSVVDAHADVQFRMIGPVDATLSAKYSTPAVKFTGNVARVADALSDVAVGVVPVFSGTGMRLKLLELLSMGIPSVTTSLGAAGLPCVDGQHVLIADDPRSFARAINALLSDAALRKTLSEEGPKLAQQYPWENIEEKVRKLVRDTLRTSGEPSRARLEASRRGSSPTDGALRISVVIPLFNKSAHVGAAIKSVLAQTRPADEILVIDDGSTDDGPLVAEAFGDRVRVVRQPNRGVSAARNLGVEMACGEAIAFLDADDVWQPEFLEKTAELLERFPNACLAGSAYEYVRAGDKITRLKFAVSGGNKYEGLVDYFALLAAKGAPPFNASATVARRSALNGVGGFPVGQRWGEDHDTWARLALAGEIVVTSEVLVTVNVGADNRASESPDPRPQLPATFTVAEALSATSDPARRSALRKYLKKVALNSPMANLRHGHLAMARAQLLESRKWTGFSFHWLLLLACSCLPMPLVNLARIIRKPIALRQGHY